MFTLAVSTAMFMLDGGDNLRFFCTGKLPAVLRLDSPTLVVQLQGVNVGVDRDRGVVAGHAALVRHRQLPLHQAVVSPLGARESEDLTSQIYRDSKFHKFNHRPAPLR